MHKLNEIFRNKRLYLWLLPFFFAFHVYVSYAALSPVKEALGIFIIYAITGFLLAVVFGKLLGSRLKGGLFAFCLLSFQFFFGSFHDFLKHAGFPSFLASYSFVLSTALVLFIIVSVLLKRSRAPFNKTTSYLNWLFVLLIFVDLATLLSHSGKPRLSAGPAMSFTSCTSCSHPDIYLILADEYAGSKELQDIFHFNNDSFESSLQQRGFHVVPGTSSNYNATLYSMASMLNMDYLQHLTQKQVTNEDQFLCRDLIRESNFLKFLGKQGYRFYNNSFFDLPGSPAAFSNIFFPTKTSLFTAQTFTGRLKHDLGFHVASEKQLDDIRWYMHRMNKKADSLTRIAAGANPGAPRFVYTHLTLPHHPYYFDSNGVAVPDYRLEDRFKLDKQAYISYLKYANRQLLQLVDHIIQSSASPPVILLLGDHGFRQFNPEAAHPYYFMNLNAVLLPDRNYQGFYPGMTNVNELRILMNTVFGQSLPLKKDSTIFLWE